MRFLQIIVASTALLCLQGLSFGQTDFDSVGFTRLLNEIGPGLENGAGIEVGQVEAPLSGNYLIDTSGTQFTGKTITDGSGIASGFSSHSRGVAIRQYGNTGSLSRGVTDITLYEANDWVGRVLGFDAKVAPLTQNFSVMNHSYIGNGLPVSDAVEMNRRIDFLAERDNITHVVGLNNSGATGIPQIFGQSYNTIVVGRSTGVHSIGDTTINGAGRTKPDLVAPGNVVSNSVPFVSSAAAVLRQQGLNSGNGNAIRNEVTKAVLMAGATKDQFPTWSNTSTRPLDATFGAGQLNIYNSYQIMEQGEFDGTLGAPPTTSVDRRGWDYNADIDAGQEYFYKLDVSGDFRDASILLTWNAEISDAGGTLDFDTLDLADLRLQLYNSTGSILGTSNSAVDNVEHLFFRNLAAGEYRIGVSSLTGSTDYALAWQFSAVPEPNSLLALSAIAGFAMLRRKNRKTA